MPVGPCAWCHMHVTLNLRDAIRHSLKENVHACLEVLDTFHEVLDRRERRVVYISGKYGA